eukprot:TRINITY_DN2219_c0_g1_i1.p1 TRINITY_DN2219_c0_g1~~TRINITY_DN2219_c0_g1_i1.p1  ORF type:complete len:158 (+),score=43.87 TRINITY_DN2219_c0_g1_i1:46-519(+)
MALPLKHVSSTALRNPSVISQRGAFYLNKVTLAGKVGRDPQIFNFPSGFSILKFPLATTSVYTNKDGEKATKTEWHQISITSPQLLEYANANITTGAHVWVSGSINSQKWTTPEGQTRYKTEVVVRNDLKIIAPGRPSSETPVEEAAVLPEEEHKQE